MDPVSVWRIWGQEPAEQDRIWFLASFRCEGSCTTGCVGAAGGRVYGWMSLYDSRPLVDWRFALLFKIPVAWAYIGFLILPCDLRPTLRKRSHMFVQPGNTRVLMILSMVVGT